MKKGKVIGLIVAVVFIGAIGFGISRMAQNPENYQNDTPKTEVILDATSFFISENETVSEEKLIEMLGEPDEVEEWDFKTSSKSYPIRTLRYDNYGYSFNSGMLQRISIDEDIAYENKDDILGMFGLKKYKNSKVNDTNVAYRITNCGVHDFWIQYDDSEKTMNSIRISYGSLFSE